MRKHQHKQILELIGTLIEANSEIKRLFSLHNFPAIIQLLSDSQDFVVQTGNYIEAIRGEGTKTVTLLEEFHEELYKAGIAVRDGVFNNGFTKLLHVQLLEIEKIVKNELKSDRIEVVFFPYKASMWDSLESIWLAAKNDSQCDVYVVPIPYYDKLPNGLLKQMHYEKDQFPDYVPVVDWREYDVEERHPDIMFIHNPYDERNHVTSVDPRFYSGRLKKLTNLLCYVPYFVTSNDISEHLCTLPGVINADKVFLESEEIRKKYSDTYRDMIGDPRGKFVALGSPKFDKVITSKPEDFELSEAWNNLIVNPNGTRNKIVLFNTSLNAIFEGNDGYLEKLNFVISVFKARDDVVLWWRPHPLSEQTFASMRPGLLEEYCSIVSKYRREAWGIYDDTSDLHRAIAWSDAYYGDPSSVATMYSLTGKPVMLQKPVLVSSGLRFDCLCEYGGYFWFAASDFNALFRMDKSTWKAEYMGSFPGEEDTVKLYSSVVVREGCLYFSPYSANSIGVYSITKGQFEQIPLSEPSKRGTVEYNPMCKFSSDVYFENDSLFLFPHTFPAIVEYRLKSKELIYHYEAIRALGAAKTKFLSYFKDAVIEDENVYLLCHLNGNLYKFNDGLVSLEKVNGSSGAKGNLGLIEDEEYFWTVPYFNKTIVKFSRDNWEAIELSGFPQEYEPGEKGIMAGTYYNGYIYMVAALANKSIKVNASTNEILIAEELEPERPDKQGTPGIWKFWFTKVIDDKLYAYNIAFRELLEYDAQSNITRRGEVSVAPGSKKMVDMIGARVLLEKANVRDDGIIFESPMLDVNCLLNALVEKDFSEALKQISEKQFEATRNLNANTDGSGGKTIYEYCRKHVGIG